MQCTCGFDNAPDARFCGRCRLALGDGSGDAIPHAAGSGTAPPVPTEGGKAGGRRTSRALMAIVAVVVVIAAAGYWWLHRPLDRHKPDNSGLYRTNVKGKYGFMDRSGKTVITPQFDAAFGFSEGLAAVRVGTKFGYINTKGEVVITPQFDAAFVFSEGLAAVQVGTKFGYINTKGLLAITPQFDDVNSFHSGRAAVKLCCGRYWTQMDTKIGHIGSNRYGFIDKNGRYIGTPGFLFVQSDFHNKSGWAADATLVRTADDRVGIMNGSGKVVIANKVDELGLDGFTAGLAPAANGGKWGYIDTKGEWVVEPQFEWASGFSEGLGGVRVGGRVGLIDQKGRFVVNPQYDGISRFSEGYASFESGGKFGFIDKKGRVVVEPKFVNRLNSPTFHQWAVGDFSEGLAPVKTDDGWGFIDLTGKMVVAAEFDTADAFQNGLAHVTVAWKEAYVTTAGAFVVNPFPGTTVRAGKTMAQTMANMRSIATSSEAFAVDHNRYPDAQSIDTLVPLISPIYITNFPRTDGWGHDFEYHVSPDGQNYRIISGAADGRVEPSSRQFGSPTKGATASSSTDIIFENGQFVQYPEGVQN